jgi:hypothetical protein
MGREQRELVLVWRAQDPGLELIEIGNVLLVKLLVWLLIGGYWFDFQ